MRFIFLLIFFADAGLFGLFEYSLFSNYYSFSEALDIDKFRNNFSMLAAFSIFMFFIYTPINKKKAKPKIKDSTIVTTTEVDENKQEENKDTKNKI